MPIQDLNVEKHTNLLIRTVVKQLNVLLNQGLGSSESWTHPGLISIAVLGRNQNFLTKHPIIFYIPKITIAAFSYFSFFCFDIKTLLIAKKDNLTSAAPHLGVTSFEIVYGFGWSADLTNC